MNTKLTKKQKQDLIRAVILAQDPHEGRYCADGVPCCVVGQYVALAHPSKLKKLVEFQPLEAQSLQLSPAVAEVLKPLQRLWDGDAFMFGQARLEDSYFYTEDETRMVMLSVIEESS